ncbi:hypothetical protein K4K54_010016, partial [Colletotrichum sp. SAR 10_86]
TPIFEPEWNRKVTKDDVHMTARECAAIVMRVMQEPKYGAGSVVETQKIGTHEQSEITVRDVPLEALYPEIPEEQKQKVIEGAQRTAGRIMQQGMRAPFEGK